MGRNLSNVATSSMRSFCGCRWAGGFRGPNERCKKLPSIALVLRQKSHIHLL